MFFPFLKTTLLFAIKKSRTEYLDIEDNGSKENLNWVITSSPLI